MHEVTYLTNHLTEIILLAYLAVGYVFWRTAVVGGLTAQASDGDVEAALALNNENRCCWTMMLIRVVVVLFWIVFMVYGIATRCNEVVSAKTAK
jgi:hypothetical protein